MKNIRTIVAYGWAVLGVPLILATFMGMDTWARLLVNSTGLKVAPKFSGGEVVKAIDHDGYVTFLHEPSFDGLFGPCKRGFVQIDWKSADKPLPEILCESIDYDRNGSVDFTVEIQTQSSQLIFKAIDPSITSPDPLISIPHGMVLRVGLKNRNR